MDQVVVDVDLARPGLSNERDMRVGCDSCPAFVR